MELPFLFFYFFLLLIPSVFGIHRYYLVYLFNRYRDRSPQAPDFESLDGIPLITIQLPVFNELYVVPRLLQAVCNFDYPRDKMEIQVLDDSTDDTTEIVARKVTFYRKQGFRIEHIHRKKREGFKAGALNVGLKRARGNFIAVFDADFVPQADFLKKVIPHFYEGKTIGMVQARWDHLNRDFSLLTQAQAVLLDGHFVIEHTARNRSGSFFNFNGTAGIWRKECILDAGGWSGETLTEDIDLSYRAQMAGWDFIYLDSVTVPAELPVDINALKTQQHRWAKGSVQVAKKLLPDLLRGNYSRRIKIEAFFHLVSNMNYLLVALIAFLMPVSLYIRSRLDTGWYGFLWFDLPIFVSATWSVSVFYYYSQRFLHEDWFDRVKYIPMSLALGIGLSVNNAKAVLEGLFNQGGEFTRTPKYAVLKRGDSWRDKRYRGKINLVSLVELGLTLHFGAALIFSLREGFYLSFPFVMLFFTGFFYTTSLSFLQGQMKFNFAPRPQIVPLKSPQMP